MQLADFLDVKRIKVNFQEITELSCGVTSRLIILSRSKILRLNLGIFRIFMMTKMDVLKKIKDLRIFEYA